MHTDGVQTGTKDLIKVDVADDVATDSGIELLHQTLPHHAQVLSKCRVKHFHIQRLVFYEPLARVACDSGTGNGLPSI